MSEMLDKFKAFVESEDFLRFLDKINFIDKLNDKYFKKFDIVKFAGQGILYEVYKL